MSFLLYLAETGASLALFYVIYEAFLRKETTFALNRFYLVAAAGLSFAIPLLRLTSPFFTAAASGPGPVPLPLVPAAAGSSGLSSGLAGLTAGWAGSVLPFSAGDILLLAYAAGVAVCLVQRARLLLRLSVFVRRGPVVRSGGLKIVSIIEDLSPFSFLGHVFLNERTVEPRERSRILAHEAAHVRGLHTLDVLLMELAVTLQWFNPFVWPYRKRLQETHEYLADAAVVAHGCGPAEYQLLLLERHVGAGAFELANNLRQSQIKRRILMLSKRRSRGPARLKPLLLLPLAALLALAFAEPKPAASAPGPSGQEKAGTYESAVAAKQKLEDLRSRESNLLERYAAATSLAEKRELLDKLHEVLRAQEECAWIISGKTETLPEPRRVEDLKRVAEELRIAAEKAEDPEKRAEYEAKLTEVYRTIEEIKAAGPEPERPHLESHIIALEIQLQVLKRQGEKISAWLKAESDPERRAEADKALKKNQATQEKVLLELSKLKKEGSGTVR
jgi:hypothetical protein